jgi:hypothetical protein
MVCTWQIEFLNLQLNCECPQSGDKEKTDINHQKPGLDLTLSVSQEREYFLFLTELTE